MYIEHSVETRKGEIYGNGSCLVQRLDEVVTCEKKGRENNKSLKNCYICQKQCQMAKGEGKKQSVNSLEFIAISFFSFPLKYFIITRWQGLLPRLCH